MDELPDFGTPEDEPDQEGLYDPFNTIDAVHFDDSMNLTSLQLKSNLKFELEEGSTLNVPPSVGHSTTLSILRHDAGLKVSQERHSNNIDGALQQHSESSTGFLTNEMHAAHQNSDIAFRAINFILE